MSKFLLDANTSPRTADYLENTFGFFQFNARNLDLDTSLVVIGEDNVRVISAR